MFGLGKKKEDVSKKMDKLLGKPPVSSSMSSAEFNSQEDYLLNLRVKLQQKEKALNEKEKVLNKEYKDLETEIGSLKKERVSLWSELEDLRKQKEKNSDELGKIREEMSGNKKLLRDAADIHNLFAKKKSEFEAKEKSLKEREHAIAAKEKHLSSLDVQIKQKEREMNRLSQVIIIEKEAFDRKKGQLLNELDELDKKKLVNITKLNELRRTADLENYRLRQAQHDVKELYLAAEQKNAAIDKKSIITDTDIERKRKTFFNEVNNREEKLSKFSLVLDKREMELKAWQEQIDKELSKLSLERKGEDVVRNKIIELTSEERVLEQKIANKQSQLSDLNSDYQMKIGELERDRLLLEDTEQQFIDRINDLEQDEKNLKAREQEFINEIDTLEKDRSLFDKKAAEFSNKISRISTFDKESAQKAEELKKWELELEKKEQKILSNADYKLNVNILKKEKDSLQKELKKLQQKVSKASEIDKRLNLKERKLLERANIIEQNDARIKQLLSDLSSERESLTNSEFNSYFANELNVPQQKEEEISRVYELVNEKNEKNYDILAMIQNARLALVQKNFSAAQEIYSQLNRAYRKLPQTSEKKKIYYEILELKTDIELSAA